MNINSWAVAVTRYREGIIKRTDEDLRCLHNRSRKLITMNDGLHPKSDTDRYHVPRKEGRWGLMGCENSIRSEKKMKMVSKQ